MGMTMMETMLCWAFLVFFLVNPEPSWRFVEAFAPVQPTGQRRSCMTGRLSSQQQERQPRRPVGFTTTTTTTTTSLCSSNNNNDGNIDDMRSLLEASWNQEVMGTVPNTAESAAEAAADSLRQATANNANANKRRFLIDLLLPQYDIQQGENLYDEVLAVDFCIALARQLTNHPDRDEDSTTTTPSTATTTSSSCILVRNNAMLEPVQRVLERRRQQEAEDEESASSPEPIALDDDDDDDEDEDEDDDDDDDDEPEYYDDFADFGFGSGGEESSADIDSFRQRLQSSWTETADEVVKDDKDDKTEANKETSTSVDEIPIAPPVVPVVEDKGSTTKSNNEEDEDDYYRLSSLLGSASISSGADMVGDVVQVVKSTLASISEDNIIILSAVTPEEMVAVRYILAKADPSKRIILVNCKLDPPPRELIGAEMVYSLTALVARAVTPQDRFPMGAQQQQQQQQQPEQPSPKIVVLRRYPRDWEVFVDIGDGFVHADTFPANKLSFGSVRGPSMEWISGVVKRFLQK